MAKKITPFGMKIKQVTDLKASVIYVELNKSCSVHDIRIILYEYAKEVVAICNDEVQRGFSDDKKKEA